MVHPEPAVFLLTSATTSAISLMALVMSFLLVLSGLATLSACHSYKWSFARRSATLSARVLLLLVFLIISSPSLSLMEYSYAARTREQRGIVF